MKQTPPSADESPSPPPWMRWIGAAGFVGALACNAVLGIEEADLTCSDTRCPDAAGVVTENESLENDDSLLGPLPGGGSPGSREFDGGADAAGEPALPGSPGSELGPNSVLPPNTGGAGNSANDDDDDSGNSGSGNAGGSPGSGGGSFSPCQGRPAGTAFCDGSIRVSCGANGAVSSSVPCPTAALCQASSGAACAACLPGQAQCNGELRLACNAELTGFDTERCASAPLCSPTGCRAPACAPNEARCRAARLERCNADRTAIETVDCGSARLCDEAAARCNACEPNAGRCEDRNTAAICDSAGAAETFIPCDALSACRAGRCELLGLGL